MKDILHFSFSVGERELMTHFVVNPKRFLDRSYDGLARMKGVYRETEFVISERNEAWVTASRLC